MLSATVSLVFLACLGSEDKPRDCETIALPFDGYTIQRAMFGQVDVTGWLKANPPRFILNGYKCVLETVPGNQA